MPHVLATMDPQARPDLISWAPHAAAVPAPSPVQPLTCPLSCPLAARALSPRREAPSPGACPCLAGKAGCHFPGIKGKRVVIPRTWLWSSWHLVQFPAPLLFYPPVLLPILMFLSASHCVPVLFPAPCPSSSLSQFGSLTLSSADQIINTEHRLCMCNQKYSRRMYCGGHMVYL